MSDREALAREFAKVMRSGSPAPAAPQWTDEQVRIAVMTFYGWPRVNINMHDPGWVLVIDRATPLMRAALEAASREGK